MQITLMHNPKAGDNNHGKEELIKALAEAGHQVRYQSTKAEDYKKALKKTTDLVIVAGGDGAVAKVARKLIGTKIPLSVLPLGTANNMARSLGFHRDIDRIIAGLESGQKRSFDVGVARGPWGKRYIFEAAGAGLLTNYIAKADKTAEKGKDPEAASKQQEMMRHVSRLRRMLQDYPAEMWKIELDGEDNSGCYILWEAMNIRSIGPALYLAPHAATKDGQFDFVCVRQDDRPRLAAYLEARLHGQENKFPLPIRRFTELKITWKKSTIRFDDEVWPDKRETPTGPVKIKIKVKPSALWILQPGNGA